MLAKFSLFYFIVKLRFFENCYDVLIVSASFTKKFRKFLENNGMKHIRLHDLRHTNATLMLTRGISPKVAQMRLGHSDFSTTMNIYSHVLESVECSAAKEIENALFKGRSF